MISLPTLQFHSTNELNRSMKFPTYHFLRYSVLIALFLVACMSSFGQASSTYVLRVTSGEVQEKMVYEVVRSLDPSSVISCSEGIVKVRLNNAITLSELIAELGSQGAGSYLVDEAATAKAASNAFPVRRDTGAPEHDDAVYNAAKKEWISAHPEEYKALNESELKQHE